MVLGSIEEEKLENMTQDSIIGSKSKFIQTTSNDNIQNNNNNAYIANMNEKKQNTYNRMTLNLPIIEENSSNFLEMDMSTLGNNIQSESQIIDKPGSKTSTTSRFNNRMTLNLNLDIPQVEKIETKIPQITQNNNNFNQTSQMQNIPTLKNASKKIFETEEKAQNMNITNSQINNNNRLTLNAMEQFKPKLYSNDYNDIDSSESEKDKDKNKKINSYKRQTMNLRASLQMLYNDNEANEDSDNSFEKKLDSKKKDNALSASPINVKNNKIFYETCLSSASRVIESENMINKNEIIENKIINPIPMVSLITLPEKKSEIVPEIEQEISEPETPKFEKLPSRETLNLNLQDFLKTPAQKILSPSINFSNFKINNDANDIDKRLSFLMNMIEDSNNMRKREKIDIEKEVNEINTQLKELQEYYNKTNNMKILIKQNIEKIEKENNSKLEKRVYSNFPLQVFNLKVLSIEANCLKIQILKKININFQFEDFNINFKSENFLNKILKIEKLNFDFLKNTSIKEKLLDDPNCRKLIHLMYNDILNHLFKKENEFLFYIFSEKLKMIIKLSSSFLYFMELISTLFTIGLEVNMKYNKENFTVICNFCLLNKIGFKVNVVIELELLNCFYGIGLKSFDVINILISDGNFPKYRTKTLSFMEDVKNFLLNKDKIKNPLFCKEFLLKLNDNILNL